MVSEKAGLAGSSHTYLLTNSAMVIDAAAQVLDVGCSYILSMTSNAPGSLITLKSVSDVSVEASNHDKSLMGKYTVSLRYEWNSGKSSKDITF